MKEYLEDLVYEGIKEKEFREINEERLNFTNKSAREVKDMVVEFARNGGKRIDFWNIQLGEIFTENPKLFMDMVVEYAGNGGKGFRLEVNWLNLVFANCPELFKDMVVEFAKRGGKELDLGYI